MNSCTESQQMVGACFRHGIQHPQWYLWDAWSFWHENTLHLYCLALARQAANGDIIDPTKRNDHRFHVHHFLSTDNGNSWVDGGIFQQPGEAVDGHDSRNVWSGSVWANEDGDIWVGYTGIQLPAPERPFLQCLAVAPAASPDKVSAADGKVLACAHADYGTICAKGYFMDRRDRLGHVAGEPGGAILAWRDPFIFQHKAETYVVFAAKAAPTVPAMGVLKLQSSDPLGPLDLMPPIVLPDADKFTQFEVPKIYPVDDGRKLLMVCATTDRKTEEQPDEEVQTLIRLYFSESIDGPWMMAGTETSVLGNAENLFGATVITLDERNKQLVLMAPYTLAVGDALGLTFAPPFTVPIDKLGLAPQLHAVHPHCIATCADGSASEHEG